MMAVARRARHWLDGEGVTRAIKIVAIISLLASLSVGVRQYELTACLAAYNDAANGVQQFRAGVASEERDALDRWILAVDEVRSLPPAVARAAFDKAFIDYRQARARIEAQRQTAPIPPPPSQTCG